MPRPAVRGPWATYSATAILVGVAVTIAVTVGPSSDQGVLVRSGAMVRGLVANGEWWRLVTCIFVHVGPIHLAVNAIGLYFLGRITEELFGTARTWALFVLAGLAGSLASFLGSPAGISAGASGAIFGLLGAVFVELTLHRQRYRTAWKRGMWGGLVVVTIAQVGVGFLYPVIDQWAHGAGLLAGAVFGVVLSPTVKWYRIGTYLARGIALMFAAFAVTAAVLVVRTSIPESLDKAKRVRHVIGEVAITAPAGWISAGELADPDGLIIVTVHRDSRVDMAAQMLAWIEKSQTIARNYNFDKVEAVREHVVSLPEGWEGTELRASFEDALESRQYYRLIIAGRAFGDTLVQLVVITPDSVAHAAPAFLAQLIASAGPT
jgi:membrane associated rhomboid family serine protease